MRWHHQSRRELRHSQARYSTYRLQQPQREIDEEVDSKDWIVSDGAVYCDKGIES